MDLQFRLVWLWAMETEISAALWVSVAREGHLLTVCDSVLNLVSLLALFHDLLSLPILHHCVYSS